MIIFLSEFLNESMFYVSAIHLTTDCSCKLLWGLVGLTSLIDKKGNRIYDLRPSAARAERNFSEHGLRTLFILIGAVIKAQFSKSKNHLKGNATEWISCSYEIT